MDEARPSDWLPLSDACDISGYAIQVLQDAIHRGDLVARKIERVWHIDRSSLLAYCATRQRSCCWHEAGSATAMQSPESLPLPDPPVDTWLTFKQAAQSTGRSLNYLYQMARTGRLSVSKASIPWRVADDERLRMLMTSTPERQPKQQQHLPRKRRQRRPA